MPARKKDICARYIYHRNQAAGDVALPLHQLMTTMSNFSCSFPVEGEVLDFRISLIHYPGGARYWVAVTRQEHYVTSFYFEENDQGRWKLSDRYKNAPLWVYALEPLLAAAIHSHRAAGGR